MNKLSSDTFLPPNDVTDPADYENDFLLWIEMQVELLRAKKFEQLDLDNLIEEMDSIGKSLRRELGSRLNVLLIHLLKCEFQPEKKSSGWLGSIEEQRSEILDLLEKNPSLRREVSNDAQRVCLRSPSLFNRNRTPGFDVSRREPLFQRAIARP